ncbi:Carboxymuconolactone decarboxylase family protein [Maioricimonas rarisocia]|uniref:Carboxymuconolactone decarboxylase family protein n=1 Tax=Maioricimonas rarisocia TaxID=2528026 RepID=A0A517Z7A3_9PLAN|nr:peroxidase-related enzyme [Maioricimonas rarisocia]QDU38350.1 Carboxymuconolactone decarboxylase family protein [Maioricimonas rarisocia]
MPFIQWIEEQDAEGEVAEGYHVYFQKRPNRTKVAEIIKCFSHRPDFMKQVMEFSWDLHFCDGHLPERVKELIATLVSGQNRCPYCMHSHAYFLHTHGADDDVVAAVGRGEIETAPLEEAEKVLLRFAMLLTHQPYRNTPEEIQKLRDAGWTEPQIAEAVYITAMFAFFNRVANGFGLESPGYFEMDGREDPLKGQIPPVGTGTSGTE